MRILLVDDHALFREALASAVLEEEFDHPVVLAASTSEEVRELLALPDGIDLALVDLDLRGQGEPGALDGFAVISRLARSDPHMPIAVVSGSADVGHAREALSRGAHGYILKTTSSHEMRYALRAVLQGDVYLPVGMRELVTGGEPGERQGEPLTPRQVEVLALMKRGLANKAIARELGLSPGTVKIHVSEILRRLGVSNRTEAIGAGERAGYL